MTGERKVPVLLRYGKRTAPKATQEWIDREMPGIRRALIARDAEDVWCFLREVAACKRVPAALRKRAAALIEKGDKP